MINQQQAPRELDLSDPKLELIVLPGQYGVIRLGPDIELPRFLAKNIVNPSPDVPRPPFLSITRTLAETSIVVSPFLSHDQLSIAGFPTALVDGPWRAITLHGPLALSGFVGTMHRLTGAIKQCNVPVFALSTYDTDYVLVPEDKTVAAIDALRADGWRIASESEEERPAAEA